jgi:hypothetical protein
MSRKWPAAVWKAATLTVLWTPAFRYPHGLSQFDGTLFVADHIGATVRAVDGVLGSDWSSAKSDFDTSLTAALLTAVPVLPKELARVMAQYARPIGVRTVAGRSDYFGSADGHAMREAKFHGPTGIAVDTSDAAAGPQLIISDASNGLIRSVNLRTEMVTTIAGCATAWISVDGPASQTCIGAPFGIAVAANGVVFFADQGSGSVRRISAPPKRAATSGSVVGERFVTRVASPPGPNLPDRDKCFRALLEAPFALCLTPSSASIPPPEDKVSERALQRICIRREQNRKCALHLYSQQTGALHRKAITRISAV